MLHSLPNNIKKYIDMHTMGTKVIDLSGYSLQKLQKNIFFYKGEHGLNHLFPEFTMDVAFQMLKIGSLKAPRVVYAIWLGSFFINGKIIFSYEKKKSSNSHKVHGAYMKTIFRDLWGVFENFAEETIGCGYENKDADRRTLQFNWKDMNNYLKLVDENYFYDYLSKIQCFRMDRFFDENDFSNPNARLYTHAITSLKEYLKDVFGEFEGFDELFDYFSDMGLNLVPLNNLCHFNYDEINQRSKPSEIIDQFKEKGFDISLNTARNIQTFLCGVASIPSFSNIHSVGFKKVCLGRYHIPELNKLNSHSVSFCLSPIDNNSSLVAVRVKRDVLERYGGYSVDHGIGDFSTKEPDAAFYAHLLSLRKAGMLDNKHSKDLEDLMGSVKWGDIYRDYLITAEHGYVYHHPIFRSILQNKGPDWICCYDECFLIPMNRYEHKLLHMEGRDEMDCLKYIIDNEFMSHKDMVDRLKHMIKHIDNIAPFGATDQRPIVNHIKNRIKQLEGIYCNVKIFSNS